MKSLIASGLFFLALLAPLHAEAPPISQADALSSLAAHSAQWQQAIKDHQPRLYFTEPEWETVRTEIAAMTGARADLRQAFFDKIDGLISKPLPVYLSPEDMVGKRGDATTLYSAREELWQREVGDEIFAFALAAKLKPDPRYATKLHELVMTALAFPTWGQADEPMGNNADLAAGHLLRGICAAYDWHRGLFSPEDQEKLRKTVAERAPDLLQALYGTSFWARGFEENHNHVSVCGLAFAGIAFYDEIPAAPEWLAASRLNFEQVLKSLPTDGSSVEGVSYWAYGIGYILQCIEATRQIIDSAQLYEKSFLKNAASFRLMASTSGLAGNVPWGDAVVKDWGSPQYILMRLAAEYQDPQAAWLAANISNPLRAGVDGLALSMLWARNAPEPGSEPSVLDARLSDNDMVTTRSGWGAQDYMLSFKGGYTNRNHSHLDAGALALAFGDEWVLIASGYGKGSGSGAFWNRTGAQKRWEFFSNATESHTALLINGRNQRSDVKARGTVTEYFSSPEWCVATMDLTSAYHDVTSVEREILHRRGDYFIVLDSITAPQSVSVEWLAQFRKETPPDAQGDLLARGSKGRVLIRLLQPEGSAFALRQPLSPKVDPPKPQFSYAAQASGEKVRFAVLIQPFASGSSAPVVKTRSEFTPDGTARIEVASANWTDQIIAAPTRQDIAFPSAAAQGPEAKFSARQAAVRATADGVTSFMALGATSVTLPGFAFQSATPCDLAATRKPDGSWAFTASRDIAAEVSQNGPR